MKTVALLAVVLALLAHACAPPHLLRIERPLTRAEIITVLKASREALAGKTIRVSWLSGAHGPDVLMGPDGRPKMIRATYGIEGGRVGGTVPGTFVAPPATSWRDDVTSIVDYTGRPAKRCDGSFEDGEMVIEYERRSSTKTWTATARRRQASADVPGIAAAFEMLHGAMAIALGERSVIDGREARALVASSLPSSGAFDRAPLLTGDPRPNVHHDAVPTRTTQLLCIDTTSLLPLRWEVAGRSGSAPRGFTFLYESIDLQLPAGVDPPDCIR
jgi:hypothetical protein